MDADDLLKQNKELLRALEWAMPYAERGHEALHPGETYEKDGYVAEGVAHARLILREGKGDASMKVYSWIHQKYRENAIAVIKAQASQGNLSDAEAEALTSKVLTKHVADMLRMTDLPALQYRIIVEAAADMLGWFTMSSVGSWQVPDHIVENETPKP